MDEDMQREITDLAHRSITLAMAAADDRDQEAARLVRHALGMACVKWGVDAVRSQMLFATNEAYGMALTLAAERLGVTRRDLWRDALTYLARGTS